MAGRRLGQLRDLMLRLMGHRCREVASVPTPSLREVKRERDSLRAALRLVDGLLSQKDYIAAQSQVRIAIISSRSPDAP